MAVLRVKDIKKLGEKELSERLNELKLELAKERANIAIGATVTSPGRIREIRRAVARIETERTSRRASGSKGESVKE
jgi:large subunit ribosomal protein L29